MIPLPLKPFAKQRLDDGKIQDPSYTIELCCLDGECDPVIMPVQVTAFAFVPDYTVTRTNIMVTAGDYHAIGLPRMCEP